MKKIFVFLAALTALFCISCSSGSPGKGEESGISLVHFTCDQYSGEKFYLDALAGPFTEKGCRVQLEKRVGPMNDTGIYKEGEILIAPEKAELLLEILEGYDLKAYADLPLKGSGASPSRSLTLYYGDRTFDIPWNAAFPETIPPREDILYFELFNFFEGLIDETEGWEEVKSPLLEDPRDNPAYYDRKVTWFGREVSLVPGTGDLYEDGRGALIDYGDQKWWLEEGFTGTWTMSEEDLEEEGATDREACFRAGEDGSVELLTDHDAWQGRLEEDRYYKRGIGVRLSNGQESRTFTIELCEEDYVRLHITAYPGPVPEEQFYETDVYVTRQEAP